MSEEIQFTCSPSFVVFFLLKGAKSQLWESYGAKTAIKPNNYVHDEGVGLEYVSNLNCGT